MKCHIILLLLFVIRWSEQGCIEDLLEPGRNILTCSSLTNLDLPDLKHPDVSKLYLRLYDSNITTLPYLAFSKYSNLREIHIHHNHIKKIKPGTFKNLKNLRLVTINSNILEELSMDAFDSLEALDTLLIENNEIGRFEGFVMSGIDKLTSFSLMGNELTGTEISNAIRNLHYVKHLYFGKNHIEQFSEDAFENLRDLKSIDISHNKLSLLDPKNVFGNLTDLTVAMNQNPWKCEVLEEIFEVFEERNIEVEDNYIYGLTNVNGILCNCNFKNTEIFYQKQNV